MFRYNFSMDGNPASTTRTASTDTAQTFSSADYNASGATAVAVLITCETNNIRFGLGGTTPTQGASGIGHLLYVGQSLRLTHPQAIRTFSFVSAANGVAGAIQTTFEFE